MTLSAQSLQQVFWWRITRGRSIFLVKFLWIVEELEKFESFVALLLDIVSNSRQLSGLAMSYIFRFLYFSNLHFKIVSAFSLFRLVDLFHCYIFIFLDLQNFFNLNNILISTIFNFHFLTTLQLCGCQVKQDFGGKTAALQALRHILTHPQV